jgi:hypothetical protein
MSEKNPLINHLWELYEKIPKELQEAIFSVETADTVFDICKKNEVEEVNKLSRIVGDSLLGILPPSEVEKEIKKTIKVSSEKASKITREIDRFIFYPLKDSLADLYGKELESPKTKPQEEPKANKKPKINKQKENKDSYREPVG